jgi:hypothetical protein
MTYPNLSGVIRDNQGTDLSEPILLTGGDRFRISQSDSGQVRRCEPCGAPKPCPEIEAILMTEETLKVYGPCPTHGLWHDLSRGCFYCMVEAVAKTQ